MSLLLKNIGFQYKTVFFNTKTCCYKSTAKEHRMGNCAPNLRKWLIISFFLQKANGVPVNHFKIHFVAYQISDIGDLVLDHSRSTKKKMLDELSCRNSVNNNNNTTNNKFILYSTKTIYIFQSANKSWQTLTHNKQYTFYEKMEIKHYNLITVQELVHWAMPNKTKRSSI